MPSFALEEIAMSFFMVKLQKKNVGTFWVRQLLIKSNTLY